MIYSIDAFIEDDGNFNIYVGGNINFINFEDLKKLLIKCYVFSFVNSQIIIPPSKIIGYDIINDNDICCIESFIINDDIRINSNNCFYDSYEECIGDFNKYLDFKIYKRKKDMDELSQEIDLYNKSKINIREIKLKNILNEI